MEYPFSAGTAMESHSHLIYVAKKGCEKWAVEISVNLPFSLPLKVEVGIC